jgi:hypothetical protein
MEKQTREQEIKKKLIELERDDDYYDSYPILQGELKGIQEGKAQAISEFKDKLVKHIKSVMWCNAHDIGLLEDLIIKINKTAQEMTK